ncbi:MAG: hypothetical protein ATN36_03440 [Epulopiscium sp. Nele67-Bin005]|nr:MAG: hypothetical protein ATN36_03440 [Epulopiscium sp. Nele67-Bin005]
MKQFKWLPLLLMTPIFLSGCWDSVEINNRSIILEFAIDKNTDEIPEDTPIDQRPTFNVTYSIPDMAKLSGTESLAKDTKTNVTVQAPTIATSIDDLQTRTRNTVTFSHVKAILMGEELLKDPKLLEEVLDAITRERLIARNVPLLAVRGEASSIQGAKNEQQPIIGLYIMNYFNNKERPVNYFKSELLGNFLKNMKETGIATIPIFKLISDDGTEIESTEEKLDSDGENNQSNEQPAEQKVEGATDGEEQTETSQSAEFEISGGAVIKDYKLIDYITKEEVRGQLLVQGEVKNSPVVISYKDRLLTYLIKKTNSNVTFEEKNGVLTCFIDIKVHGNVIEYVSNHLQNVSNIDVLNELEILISGEVYKQAHVGIDRAKDMNVDFLGLGLQMYRHQPELWEYYEHNWNAIGFANVKIVVDVDVEIENTGLLQ